MKRTEIGLGIVGLLVIAGIVIGIVFLLDDGKDDELRETREALDVAQEEVAELDAALVEVEAELTEVQARLVETEVELAATPPLPAPIYRLHGTWFYSDQITAESELVEYWGSTITGTESKVSVVAEGEFALTEPVPTLVIFCYENGSRRIYVENVALEPSWNEERERIEYDVSYRIAPTVDGLPTGERGAQWLAGQDFDFVDQWTAYPNLDNLLYLQLKHTEQLEVALTGKHGESVELTFVVSGAFDTRLQPNIERCGDYH